MTWLLLTLILFALLATLLGYGLERQRRELAHLRREAEAWVAADLRLKRSRMGMALNTDFDPLRWLGRIIRTAFPDVSTDGLEAEAQDGPVPGVWVRTAQETLFVTPRPPGDVRRRLKKGGSGLDAPLVGAWRSVARGRARRVGLADDPLLDLAWAAAARHWGLPDEEPRELFIYRARAR